MQADSILEIALQGDQQVSLENFLHFSSAIQTFSLAIHLFTVSILNGLFTRFLSVHLLCIFSCSKVYRKELFHTRFRI